jgi:hypothetical protein
MTPAEALETLGIESWQRDSLMAFAGEIGGSAGLDIRNAIELRELAVGEFLRLIANYRVSKAA